MEIGQYLLQRAHTHEAVPVSVFVLILQEDGRRRHIVSVYIFFVGESETRGFQFAMTEVMQSQQDDGSDAVTAG